MMRGLRVGVVCCLSLQAVTAQVMNDYQEKEEDARPFEILGIVTIVILVLTLVAICFIPKMKRACKKKNGEPVRKEIPRADDVELEVEVDEQGHCSRVRRSSEVDKMREAMANHAFTENGFSRQRAWSTESPPSHLGTAVLLNLSEEQLDKVTDEDTAEKPSTSEDVPGPSGDAQQRLLDTETMSTPLKSEAVPLLSLTPATPQSSKPSSPTNTERSLESQAREVTRKHSDTDQDVHVDSESGLKSVRKPRDFYETPTLDRKKDNQPLLASEVLNTSISSQ